MIHDTDKYRYRRRMRLLDKLARDKHNQLEIYAIPKTDWDSVKVYAIVDSLRFYELTSRDAIAWAFGMGYAVDVAGPLHSTEPNAWVLPLRNSGTPRTHERYRLILMEG